jgi:phenylacetate-coenzyme A ligase PaaK-like adenylate-forming protein
MALDELHGADAAPECPESCRPKQAPDLPSIRLRELLVEVCASVPFYRNTLPELTHFPIVSKRVMIAKVEEFISEAVPGHRLRLIETLTKGPRSGVQEWQFNDNLFIEQTSGSSGIPFLIVKTREERLKGLLGIWRFRRSIDSGVSPHNFLPLIHRRPGMERPKTTIDALDAARERGMRWVHANPPFIRGCLRLTNWAAFSMPATLRFIENSGSQLDHELRQSLEARTKIRIADQYGCREVWAIGYATGVDGFIPVDDNVIVEIVDAKGKRVEGPGTVGRLLVTGLCQKIFPFIRYDTGDLGYFSETGGRRTIVLSPNRQHHLILGAPTRTYGTDLFKNVMINVFRNVGYIPIDGLQIRQLSEIEYELAIAKTGHKEEIRAAVELEFNRLLSLPEPARFSLRELVDEGEYPVEKPCLFTNRYFRRSTP